MTPFGEVFLAMCLSDSFVARRRKVGNGDHQDRKANTPVKNLIKIQTNSLSFIKFSFIAVSVPIRVILHYFRSDLSTEIRSERMGTHTAIKRASVLFLLNQKS